MKFLIIIAFLSVVPATIIGQTVIDSSNHRIYLREVYEVAGNFNQLKIMANEWVAKSYNNSNYVTRINEDGKILTKGSFAVSAEYTAYGITTHSPRTIEYTLDLEFKDGRYKVEITEVGIKTAGLSEDISIYMMGPDEYRELLREIYKDYDGIGANAGRKRIENDKKLIKDYEGMHDYGEAIIGQIVDKLNSINASLLLYVKSNQKDEDW